MSDHDQVPREPGPEDDVEAHSSTGWDLSSFAELRDLRLAPPHEDPDENDVESERATSHPGSDDVSSDGE